MYNNAAIRKQVEGLVGKMRASLGWYEDDTQSSQKRRVSFVSELTASTEKTPLLGISQKIKAF